MSRLTIWRSLLVGAAVALSLLPAQCRALTIFQAHFNGELVTTEGQVPLLAENVEFAPGRCGTQGIMVTDETKLQYPARGNISLYQGTVGMWVRPVGWRGGVPKKTRFLLDWRQEKTNKENYLGFVQNGSSTVNVHVRDQNRQIMIAMTSPSSVFGDQTWVHLAAAWSAFTSTIRLYVNGQLLDERSSSEPVVIGPTGEAIRLGSIGAYSVDGIIDEVVISDQFLEQDEVMAEARKPIAAYSE